MPAAKFPSLYEVNTRVVLEELSRSRRLGRDATFDDVPDAWLDEVAALGFDWVWLMGVWQTGEAARKVSLAMPELQFAYHDQLPDFDPQDVSGSPFAVQSYTVHSDFGGPAALERLRTRMRQRNLRLMLDFVCNHVAPDHAWVRSKPEWLIQGTPEDLQRDPANFVQLDTPAGARVFALGRDPYYPGWPDTLQLNYRHAGLFQAMQDELLKISGQCDGVRCDMAMLVLPEIFQRTWGERSRPADGSPPGDQVFWPAAVGRVRRTRPEFVFLAEVYWNLEYALQQLGFDYTYDKHLYDCLRGQDAGGVHGHLWADAEYMRRSARFLENHDEPRAAAVFPPAQHRAAAALTYLVPGLRFFHEGQLEGRRISVCLHLGRRRAEMPDPAVSRFYRELLAVLRRPEVRNGVWQLLTCHPAWEDNPTWEHFIAFRWDGAEGSLLVAVNYCDTQGQCYVGPLNDFRGRNVVLHDLLGPDRYERDGTDLASRGLFLDMPAWGVHAFDVRAV